MDSPESRPLASAPWLFERQGVALIALLMAIAATFAVLDLTFLAGCMLLVALVARGWARVCLARVLYTRRPSTERAFCGDELHLESVLVNPRPLPLPWLEVWDQIPLTLDPEGLKERSYSRPDTVWVQRGLAVWPYQRLRWRRRLTCRKRGAYRLGEKRLRSGDPFGFFERERILHDEIEVLVYPRVVPVRRLGLPMHHPSVDVVSPRSIVTDPTRTAAVRDYRPDDPQRLIHWPTTARRSALHVRVLEPATSLHVSLVFDARGFAFGIYRGELLESMLSALASLAVYLQAQGAPVSFHTNTQPPLAIPPGASVAHLQSMLEALARLDARGGTPLVPWLLETLPRGNTLVLGASDMTPQLYETVSTLQAADYTVVLLLAIAQDRPRPQPVPGAVLITPGCDLAAVLEGRA